MNQKERRDAQMVYLADESVYEEQKECRKLLQKLNFIDRSDFEEIMLLSEQAVWLPGIFPIMQ